MNPDDSANAYIELQEERETAIDVIMSDSDIEYEQAVTRYEASLQRLGIQPIDDDFEDAER